MFRNKSVDVHRFSMIPSADVPRSSFSMDKMYKTTFDGGYLIPVFVDEVLPGDTFNVHMTAFARLATPLFPILDNMHLDSFFSSSLIGWSGTTGSSSWVSSAIPATRSPTLSLKWSRPLAVTPLTPFRTTWACLRWARSRAALRSLIRRSGSVPTI